MVPVNNAKSPCLKNLDVHLNSLSISPSDPNCSLNNGLKDETRARQPKSCRLAYFPDHILQDIFVLAGPGNNLNLTCSYFNQLFKFENTGLDENGQWHNLHLVRSMIKMHFLRDLNREIRRYKVPLAYVDELCKQYDELHDQFGSFYDTIDILEDRLENLRKFVRHINDSAYYVDPEILFFRFATENVTKVCCSQANLGDNRQSPSGSWPILFAVEGDEPEKRLGLAAGFFKEAFYWLHEIQNQPEFMLPENIDKISRDLHVSDYKLGGELSVIDKAFEDFRHYAKDASNRILYFSDLDTSHRPMRLSDSDPSVHYLKEGPSFCRRLGAIIESNHFEMDTLDDILLALFNSCAKYEIPQGHTVSSLTEGVLGWQSGYSFGDEIDPRTVPKVLRIYQSLKIENKSCENPNFNVHDWCEAITMIYNFVDHPCSQSSWCRGNYCMDVVEIDMPEEDVVDGLVEKIFDENLKQKVEDWMEYS